MLWLWPKGGSVARKTESQWRGRGTGPKVFHVLEALFLSKPTIRCIVVPFPEYPFESVYWIVRMLQGCHRPLQLTLFPNRGSRRSKLCVIDNNRQRPWLRQKLCLYLIGSDGSLKVQNWAMCPLLRSGLGMLLDTLSSNRESWVPMSKRDIRERSVGGSLQRFCRATAYVDRSSGSSFPKYDHQIEQPMSLVATFHPHDHTALTFIEHRLGMLVQCCWKRESSICRCNLRVQPKTDTMW